MILKFEDYVFTTGPSYEYINSDHISRIRITRKRIKIYLNNHLYDYIFVGKTKHNMDELKKIRSDIL